MTGTKDQDDHNVFRDTPIRYLGYCNEVGESFRYQFPRFVVPSYVISFGYCCADSVQAGYKVWSATTTTDSLSESQRQQETLRAMVDTVIWQSTASVMVPGFTINCIVKATRWMVRRPALSPALPTFMILWLPTAAGLGSIPLVVQPIDHMTDILLDKTLRRVWTPAIKTTSAESSSSEST